MADFPEEMRIPEYTKVDVAIPGWHINAHGESCRENFNLSYMEGAGRTVGEDIETTWAGTNALGPSVREMGPAARHDTLNDHWNGWNFRKIVGFRAFLFPFSFPFNVICSNLLFVLGILFLKRFKNATKMSEKQTDIFNQLSSTFTTETITKWEAMVDAWNKNPKTAPNPYREPASGN